MDAATAKRRGWVLMLALLATAPAHAGDLAITPVRLELSRRASVATIKVRNAGAHATSLQMRVFTWRQVDGEDRLERSEDVLANPGAFELAPGAEQLARVGLNAPASSALASYRVIIQELPLHEPGRAGEVATLLRVSIPIFVEAERALPALAWTLERTDAGGLALRAVNSGTAHVQLTRLSLKRANGETILDEAASLYVLPGATRRVGLSRPITVRAGEALTLRADTDGPVMTALIAAPVDQDETALR